MQLPKDKSIISLIDFALKFCLQFRIICIHKCAFIYRPFTWIVGFPITAITGHTRVTRSGYSEEPKDTIGFMIDVISREKCAYLLTLPPLLNALMERSVGKL